MHSPLISHYHTTPELLSFIGGIKEGSFDYQKALLLLSEAADRERGIRWLKDDTNKKITRFDSSIGQAPTQAERGLFSRNDYLAQVVNLYSAATEIVLSITPSMLPEVRASGLVTVLTNKAIDAFTKGLAKGTESECRAFLKECNTEVTAFLCAHGLSHYSPAKVSSLLRLAESFTCLKNEQHYTIETVTKIRDIYVAQTDVPITTPTQEQKDVLQNVHQQPWYQDLSIVERGLFRRNQDAILAGEHVVATGLRNIPILRNAFRKEISEVHLDASGQISNRTRLGGYLHSAAISGTQESESVRTEATHRNYRQLCSANPAQEVAVLTLCSRIPGQGLFERWFPTLSTKLFDTYVVDTTAAVVPRDRLVVIPTNVLRVISKNTISRTCEQLIAEYVRNTPVLQQPQYGNLLEYLTQKPPFFGRRLERLASNEINDLGNLEERLLAKEILDLRRLQIKQSGIRGRWNSLVEIVTSPFREHRKNKNSRIAGIVVALWEKVYKDSTICVSCKSGKDRTGYESVLADSMIIKHANPTLTKVQIQEALSTSSHVQFLASSAGGKPGCFGLKALATDTRDGIVATASQNLFTKAASSSSSISLNASIDQECLAFQPKIGSPMRGSPMRRSDSTESLFADTETSQPSTSTLSPPSPGPASSASSTSLTSVSAESAFEQSQGPERSS